MNAEPDTPLLYVLRNDFELNGAKFGCGLSQCGACTVLVDGVATRSCVTPIGSSSRAEITTLEGLGTLDKLHPLQQAFIDEQAAQCGYCTNGMIMAAKELLDRNPRPTEAQVRDALAGNLCRCGTHNRIVRAVAARRAGEREDLSMNAPHLTRRDFTAGLGGIVLAFRLAPGLRSGAGKRRGFPAACRTNRMLDALAARSMPTAPPPSSPARSSWGRASSPRWRRSRPRSSICRSRASRSSPATPAARRTKARPPAASRSRTAAPRCGSRARRCARSCSISRPRSSAFAADQLKVADGVIIGAGRPQGQLRRARRSADLKREATGKVDAEAAGAAQARRASRSPRVDIPGQGHRRRGLCAGHAAAGHGAWPRCAAAAIRRAA